MVEGFRYAHLDQESGDIVEGVQRGGEDHNLLIAVKSCSDDLRHKADLWREEISMKAACGYAVEQLLGRPWIKRFKNETFLHPQWQG